VKSNKCFQVRPKYIKKALDWLVINNDQYKDVAVINRPEEDFDVLLQKMITPLPLIVQVSIGRIRAVS